MILRAIQELFTRPDRTSTAKSVRRPMRPKLTGFEALEERYLLSHCTPPTGEPPDQAEVDAYNACLADESNNQVGDDQQQAEDTMASGGTGTGDDQGGDVTQQNLTFAGASSAGENTYTLDVTASDSLDIAAHEGSAGDYTHDVDASADFTWDEAADFSDTDGSWNFILSETGSASFGWHASGDSSGESYTLDETALYNGTLHEDATASGTTSGSYRLDASSSLNYSLHSDENSTGTYHIDESASGNFSWDEEAHASDSDGSSNFTRSESASGSFSLQASNETGDEDFILSESASFNASLHADANWSGAGDSGTGSGDFTIDVTQSGNYSLSASSTAGNTSLLASASGGYSLTEVAHASDPNGSANYELSASGSANFHLTASGSGTGTSASGTFSLSKNSSGSSTLHADGSYTDESGSKSFTADATGSYANSRTESGSYTGDTISGTYSASNTSSNTWDYYATMSDGTCTATIDQTNSSASTHTESGNLDGTNVTSTDSQTSSATSDEEHCTPDDAAHSMDDLTGIPWDIWTALQGQEHQWWIVIVVDQPKPDSDDSINIITGEHGHGFICLVSLQGDYQPTYDGSYCIGFAGISGTGVKPVEGYLKNDAERWWTIAMAMPVSPEMLAAMKAYYEEQLKLHAQHMLMYSLAHLNCVGMVLYACWTVGIGIYPETDPIACTRPECLPFLWPFFVVHQGYTPGDLGWYIKNWGALWPGAIVINNPNL